jgi:hypothetical protein
LRSDKEQSGMAAWSVFFIGAPLIEIRCCHERG